MKKTEKELKAILKNREKATETTNKERYEVKLDLGDPKGDKTIVNIFNVITNKNYAFFINKELSEDVSISLVKVNDNTLNINTVVKTSAALATIFDTFLHKKTLPGLALVLNDNIKLLYKGLRFLTIESGLLTKDTETIYLDIIATFNGVETL